MPSGGPLQRKISGLDPWPPGGLRTILDDPIKTKERSIAEQEEVGSVSKKEDGGVPDEGVDYTINEEAALIPNQESKELVIRNRLKPKSEKGEYSALGGLT